MSANFNGVLYSNKSIGTSPVFKELKTIQDQIANITPESGTFIDLFTENLNVSSLSINSAVATDPDKNLISIANTGTGSNVLAISPLLTTPNIGNAVGASLNLSSLTASRGVSTDSSKNLISVYQPLFVSELITNSITSATIPVSFFSTEAYRHCSVTFVYEITGAVGNLILSARDNTNAPVPRTEAQESQTEPTSVVTNTNDGRVGTNVETAGSFTNFVNIEISRPSVSPPGRRYNFRTEGVYILAGTGSTRIVGSGFFDVDPANFLNSLVFTSTLGNTINGKYLVRYF